MNDLEVYCGPILVINEPYSVTRKAVTDELSDRLFVAYSAASDTTSYVISNVKGPREFHTTNIEYADGIVSICEEEEILWFETEFAKEIKYFKALFTEVTIKFGLFSFCT